MSTATLHTQLQMTGMPKPLYANAKPAGSRDITPGQEVTYLGRIHGGPGYGARGIVIEVRGRKARVNLGRAGIWNIPYYFLAVPLTRAA